MCGSARTASPFVCYTEFMLVENRLLAALPRKDYQRLHAHMERVPLSFADVLCEPGDTLREVYFVNNGIVSLLSRVENGACLEVGMVGNEGMVGLSVFLGADTTFCRAMVQATGSAMRMNADWFQKDLRQTGSIATFAQPLYLRATHAGSPFGDLQPLPQSGTTLGALAAHGP